MSLSISSVLKSERTVKLTKSLTDSHVQSQTIQPSPTKASPNQPTAAKSRLKIGLAVGLSIPILMVIIVASAIGSYFIYKRFRRNNTRAYELLPTATLKFDDT